MEVNNFLKTFIDAMLYFEEVSDEDRVKLKPILKAAVSSFYLELCDSNDSFIDELVDRLEEIKVMYDEDSVEYKTAIGIINHLEETRDVKINKIK